MILLYVLFILYLLYVYLIYYRDRRYELIALIRSKEIRSLEWRHRGKTFQIKLTKESIAKLSKNTGIGIGKIEGIIIRHFWMEGKKYNTDTFSIKKLKFDS